MPSSTKPSVTHSRHTLDVIGVVSRSFLSQKSRSTTSEVVADTRLLVQPFSAQFLPLEEALAARAVFVFRIGGRTHGNAFGASRVPQKR